MKQILFLHGFYASGQCVPAIALREAFAGRADVLQLQEHIVRLHKSHVGIESFSFHSKGP